VDDASGCLRVVRAIADRTRRSRSSFVPSSSCRLVLALACRAAATIVAGGVAVALRAAIAEGLGAGDGTIRSDDITRS
jgi:hypothetical protein